MSSFPSLSESDQHALIPQVLALHEQLDGGSGRYGSAGNAEAPAPGAPAE